MKPPPRTLASRVPEMSQRPRQPGELGFAVLLLLFSAAAAYQAYQISGFSGLSSAGVFPLLASAAMLLSGGLSLWRALRSPAPEGRFFTAVLPPRVLGYMGLVVVYGVAMAWLGFIIASGVFLLISLLMLSSMPWYRALATSAGALLLIVLVFRHGFQVILP